MFLDVLPISVGAGLLAAFAAFALFFVLLGIAVYVYMAFAFMAIAKKTGYKTPGVAWIPLVGPALILADAAKMHWWPILLIIGFFIPVVNWIFAIAFAVFWIIWLWKTFEVLGRPGWWAILCIINVLMLVFIGIVAWSDIGKAAPSKQKPRKR